MRLLRRHAPSWQTYFDEVPSWHAPEVQRVTQDQLEQRVRFYDYKIQRLQVVRDQVDAS